MSFSLKLFLEIESMSVFKCSRNFISCNVLLELFGSEFLLWSTYENNLFFQVLKLDSIPIFFEISFHSLGSEFSWNIFTGELLIQFENFSYEIPDSMISKSPIKTWPGAVFNNLFSMCPLYGIWAELSWVLIISKYGNSSSNVSAILDSFMPFSTANKIFRIACFTSSIKEINSISFCKWYLSRKKIICPILFCNLMSLDLIMLIALSSSWFES